MSCSVSLGEYDGDSPRVFCPAIVTARKVHKCHECRAEIQPRERYERITGCWDGRWETYRFCLACSEIQKEFSENGRAFGVTWEFFREEWHHGANLQSCLDRVHTVAAKTKLRSQWLKWKGLE